jgi:N-acetyl-anhydromuramyl-L-alanine amidase AmpD
MLLEAVRPETGFLLKRLRERLGSHVLSELLAHEDAAHALHGETRLEVELLRAEILIELWQKQATELQTYVAQAKKDLEARHQRLQKLERYGSDVARGSRANDLQKQIQDFEHRMYFMGEVIPLEELDRALQITIGEVLERE